MWKWSLYFAPQFRFERASCFVCRTWITALVPAMGVTVASGPLERIISAVLPLHGNGAAQCVRAPASLVQDFVMGTWRAQVCSVVYAWTWLVVLLPAASQLERIHRGRHDAGEDDEDDAFCRGATSFSPLYTRRIASQHRSSPYPSISTHGCRRFCGCSYSWTEAQRAVKTHRLRHLWVTAAASWSTGATSTAHCLVVVRSVTGTSCARASQSRSSAVPHRRRNTSSDLESEHDRVRFVKHGSMAPAALA
jgi:hypothetical protein